MKKLDLLIEESQPLPWDQRPSVGPDGSSRRSHTGGDSLESCLDTFQFIYQLTKTKRSDIGDKMKTG